MSTQIHIVHLYPNEMNTYGDRGNLLTLVRRAEWHGLEPIVHYYHSNDKLPSTIDLVLGGGGQDSAQTDIQLDILRIGPQLHALANDDVPMLMVCGTYQLFGHRFTTLTGQEIKGIGILDLETIGGPKRLIGNVAVDTKDFGTLYGFENHSGKTNLAASQPPLGTVRRGNGNNGHDKTEGARNHNVIGTYLHGPLLPNNPILADWLLTTAAQRHDPAFQPNKIEDTYAAQTRIAAANRKY